MRILPRIRSLRSIVFIALLVAIAGGATMAFGASDVTTPRAIPYMTSNVATGLNQASAIAIDRDGNIYVGENALTTNSSALVKKIDAKTGAVTIFAGGGVKSTSSSPCPSPDMTVSGGGNASGDGCPATYANFGNSTNGGIRGLVVYNNYLYIEDNGGYMIHRVNLASPNIMEWVGGIVSSTWKGDGTITPTFPIYKPPTGLGVDPFNGNVYFGAGGTNAPSVRMISSDTNTCANAINGPFTPPCIITVVNYKGQSTAPTNACEAIDQVVPAYTATANNPTGFAFDAEGNLYFVDKNCSAIRKLTRNSVTHAVDQNSVFSTVIGNNSTTGTSPSWYDASVQAGSLGYLGPIRSVVSAGRDDLYISTTTAVYLYDATTRWAHRIWGDVSPAGCPANSTTPFIGCPAPWAIRNDNSGYGQMAVDGAGNLYVTEFGSTTSATGAVDKAAIGTDFVGIAPQVTASLPTMQYVLLHGGGVIGATADNPFNAVVTTDTSLPEYGCTPYTATGDNGTDCVIAATYTPSVKGQEQGLLHVQGANTVDLTLLGMGNPTVPPQVSLTADKSVCALGGPCDLTLTASVTPGDIPPSTGLVVSGDMTACGGSATQAFAGSENTFTYTCSLPTVAAGDTTLGPVTVKDDQSRSGNSNTILVSIIDAPVAQPQSVTVTYNTPKPITLTATGAGNLTYAVVTQPTHGTLSGAAPALTYTPNPTYVGSDSFTFKATGSVDSLPATVSINVLPAAPVAAEQSVSVSYDTATPITLASTGTGTLTYAIVRPPAHGSLTGNAPNVSYTPDSNYSGPDSFTFKTTDGNGQESAPATVSITVLSVVPLAQDQAVVVTYNTPKGITLTATGMGTLTYSIVTQPLHGTLSGAAPSVIYTPNSNYLGSDSFTFKASNGSDSAPATVNIMVLPAAPVATAQTVTVNYNGSAPIILAATGTGTLTYAVVTQPLHGTLSGTAPNLTYTAASNYSGLDSFTFKATDSNSQDSVPATVNITVLPAAPVATAQSVTINYNGSKPITLAANGTGALIYTVVSQPSHGTLGGTAPNLTYTAASNYSGADSFTFKAADSNNQDSASATVSIIVLPALPVANTQSVSAIYNTTKPITLSATGAGNLTYAVVSQPSHGTLSGTAPALTYTPASNYLGADSFTFKATDGNGQDSAPATVSITVVPPVPVATAQPVTVTYNTAKAITLTGTGFGTLTFTVVSQPAHGTLSGTAPNLTYTPNANYNGSDSFTFKATDSNSQDSAPATVSITVNASDLTVVAASGGSTTATVTAGSLAVFNLQVSGWNGSAGPISFACSGAPAGATCGVSPSSATLNGTTPIAVAVMVQTTGSNAAAAVFVTPSGPTGKFPWGTAFALTALLATLLALKKGKMQWKIAGACAALVMVATLSACGGKGQVASTQTLAGTYTVTITAASGGVTKAVPLTLNVR